jgi:hypothetical protein
MGALGVFPGAPVIFYGHLMSPCCYHVKTDPADIPLVISNFTAFSQSNDVHYQLHFSSKLSYREELQWVWGLEMAPLPWFKSLNLNNS